MNPNERFYEASLERTSRYHLNLADMQNVDLVSELVDGYCITPSMKDEFYVCAFKDKELIAEGSQLEVYRFLILRLFIDKYSTGKYELPELTKIRLVGQSKEEAIEWNRKAMTLLLRPLGTYEDLLDSFEEVRQDLARDPKKVETFDGHESKDNGEKALNGQSPYYEADEYRVTQFVEEDVWDIYSKKERSNDLNFLFRIYGRKYLHEYILNNHISAVL